MELERGNLVSPASEVPVIEGQIVTAIRELADRGWGSKAIARVAADAFVDVATVRYSVPYRLVREHVEVAIADDRVQIFHGTTVVATHRRVREPCARVLEPAHVAGLWRTTAPDAVARNGASLAALGRSLETYAAIIGGAQ
jgi:hypothetical protein